MCTSCSHLLRYTCHNSLCPQMKINLKNLFGGRQALRRFRFSKFLVPFLLSRRYAQLRRPTGWKQNPTGGLSLFGRVISTFLFKDGMTIQNKGKVFQKGTGSKIASPILSGTSFLVLYSAAVLLEKETLSDLFSLQNVAAVNKANKMPSWGRNRWKWILNQYENQCKVNSFCIWSLEIESWLHGSQGKFHH